VVFVVNLQSVLDLSYHTLTKSSKTGLKKQCSKVFGVFGVGVCGVLGRPFICFGSIISSLDKIEQNWLEKPRFMVFVVVLSGVCGRKNYVLRCLWCLCRYF
jgi:hypothetical protein